ncbi:glutathionylspermidine synthase family protein [Shigella sonnei]
MMRDDNLRRCASVVSNGREPLWKSISSNKRVMPLRRRSSLVILTLCILFDGEKPQIAAGESYVRKPIYSARRRKRHHFRRQTNVVDHADGDYADEPMIYQVFSTLLRIPVIATH